jgi:hypothetical protein
MSTVPPPPDDVQPRLRYWGSLYAATVMAWNDGVATPLDPSIAGLDSFLKEFIRMWQQRVSGRLIPFRGAESDPPRIPKGVIRRAKEARERSVARFGPIVTRAEQLHATVREWARHGDVPSEQVQAAWQEARRLHEEAHAARVELGGYPNSLFPGNPVELWPSSGYNELMGRPCLPPHRLYLDVTDAKLKDVRAIWTLVEWYQASLRLEGHSRKRPRGNQPGPRSPKVTRLVTRAGEIGEAAAMEEYLARFPKEHGHRRLEKQWWRRTVTPHLG